jgi:ubiquinone/menaquinone biosynthesis C-methylase UbiE
MGSVAALPFRTAAFDTVVSCCAFKHWPDPLLGLSECSRVVRPGGQLLVVEIDGGGTLGEVRRFARMTRIPPGLREAYVRFAMRTVVGVAPQIDQLTNLLATVALGAPKVGKVAQLPFVVAMAKVPS